MTVRAVFGGDAHITETAWVGRMEVAGDSIRALRQLVDLCIQHECDLFLPGDGFDAARPSPVAVLQFQQELERLPAGRTCWVVLGNHDDRSGRSWVEVSTRCKLLGGRKIEIPGTHIVVEGVDYTPPWVLKTKLAATRFDCDVLMMHQAWYEIAGGRAVNSLSELQLDPTRTVLYTGDYHQTVGIQTTTGLQVISPGANYLTQVNEPTEKFAFLLYVNEAGRLSFVQHKLVSRDLTQRLLLVPSQVEELAAELRAMTPPAHGMLPIFRVRYSADVPIGPLTAAAEGRAVLFMDRVDAIEPANFVEPTQEDMPVETLEGALDKCVADPSRAAFYKAICRLSGEDLRKTLDDRRERFFQAFKEASRCSKS